MSCLLFLAFCIPNRREGHEWHMDVYQVRRRHRRMPRHGKAQPYSDRNLLAT